MARRLLTIKQNRLLKQQGTQIRRIMYTVMEYSRYDVEFKKSFWNAIRQSNDTATEAQMEARLQALKSMTKREIQKYIKTIDVTNQDTGVTKRYRGKEAAHQLRSQLYGSHVEGKWWLDALDSAFQRFISQELQTYEVNDYGGYYPAENAEQDEELAKIKMQIQDAYNSSRNDISRNDFAQLQRAMSDDQFYGSDQVTKYRDAADEIMIILTGQHLAPNSLI